MRAACGRSIAEACRDNDCCSTQCTDGVDTPALRRVVLRAVLGTFLGSAVTEAAAKKQGKAKLKAEGEDRDRIRDQEQNRGRERRF